MPWVALRGMWGTGTRFRMAHPGIARAAVPFVGGRWCLGVVPRPAGACAAGLPPPQAGAHTLSGATDGCRYLAGLVTCPRAGVRESGRRVAVSFSHHTGALYPAQLQK